MGCRMAISLKTCLKILVSPIVAATSRCGGNRVKPNSRLSETDFYRFQIACCLCKTPICGAFLRCGLMSWGRLTRLSIYLIGLSHRDVRRSRLLRGYALDCIHI